MKIGIVDYGVGNIRSVYNAIKHIEHEPILVSDPSKLSDFGHLIFPGVGNFGYVVNEFSRKGFSQPVIEYIQGGNHFLGICIGMQILFDHSEESEIERGLGILPGVVKLIDINLDSDEHNCRLKLPHIGWTTLNFDNDDKDKILNNIKPDDKFYFVHSYTVEVKNSSYLIANSTYGNSLISSIVGTDNTYGVQFHPERSGSQGLKLLENFCSFK